MKYFVIALDHSSGSPLGHVFTFQTQMVLGISAPTLILKAIPSSGLSSGLAVEHHKYQHSTTITFATLETPTAPNRRPAVILPGLGNNSTDYQNLQLTLENYGVPSVVANVSRIDWLRNAAGLADPNYWSGTLRPRPVLDWYLKRVDEAICEAKLLAQGGGLSLIGHSAGGWLARVYMEEYGISDVSLLLTLGTPHMPPPKGSAGVVDQTRGLLDYVERYCARAVYTPQLKYVCIAGRYIHGARFFGNVRNNEEPMPEIIELDKAKKGQASTNKPLSSSGTMRARFVGQGYKQVCGKADVWGDGVVPEVSAHLEGAMNISLDGVYHSPVGSDNMTRPWYGSPAVVAKWVDHLLLP